MAKSLQQVLGYLTLTGAVQTTTSGIPQPLPEAFMKATKKAEGNKSRYTRVTGERRVARIAKYGSPARERGLKDVGEVDIKLIHTFEQQRFDPLVMKQLRSKDAFTQDLALDEVSRQVREFKRLFENLRIGATFSALRYGAIYYDADGNLLPTSSGAIETHDFNVSANNKDQLNGIISASWALNSTNIPLQLRNLKKRAAKLTGLPIKYALYGENIPTYMTQNDYVLDYLARNPTQNADFLQSNEIGTLFGLTWVPVYEAFFEDADGTNQDLWSADGVTFTPEVSEAWWDVIEGSYEVPTTVNVMNDAEAAMRSMSTVYGQFGFGTVGYNPPAVTGFYGDTFIPALKNPDAVYLADVTP